MEKEIQLPTYACEYKENLKAIISYDDPVWDQLPVMDLAETTFGTPVEEFATGVKAFWTETALYFRFFGKDSHLVASYTEHDDPIYEEDVVEVFISETGDMVSYKEFEVSPANVKFDAAIINDPSRSLQVDTGWHLEGWETSVDYFPEKSEIYYVWKMPFAGFIGGVPQPGASWRINCYRIDRGAGIDKPDLYMSWSPTGIVDFHTPYRFGHLHFVK
ncbi:carbohydrate-binding family 9-like protein [Paenibacillus eucommiae]|uniref:Carbohydrate-binding domain-containing protein n=1 Tax=Paenibacillus eucommiae TaxID=1355755 RepID=A0ABS4IYQ0_9BACL|nr:carbohydrate-binding family 9-like protein [Paenibacillus eucommiae]MBP1992724.1 hypothetical protein [Paenibacillus eucommiae]